MVKQKDQTSELLAVKNIEWRPILATGELSFTVELSGIGAKNKISIGVLHMHISLVPKMDRFQLLNQSNVNQQLQLEKKAEGQNLHEFFEYSQRW